MHNIASAPALALVVGTDLEVLDLGALWGLVGRPPLRNVRFGTFNAEG
jgi:hypothetical protein